MINNHYTGVRQKYAYAQTVDSLTRSKGIVKIKPHFTKANGMDIECVCLFLCLQHYAAQLD
jgi:hypothetical protein